MNNILDLPTQTMSSLEIAELTGKQHQHVLADIRKMLIELDLEGVVKPTALKLPSGQTATVFNLDEELSLTLVSGYNLKMRHAIIKRWKELEDAKPELTDMQMISQMALRIDAGRKAQAALTLISEQNTKAITNIKEVVSKEIFDIKTKDVDTQAAIADLQIKNRRGVPLGMLGASQACKRDGRLSRAAFNATMRAWSVPYIDFIALTENGIEVPSQAFKFKNVVKAINALVESATQVTEFYYISPYILGRFKIN